MSYQEKAEQYVREQLPELMELSFGCEVTPDGGNGSVAKIYKIHEDDTFDGLIEGTTEDGEAEFVVTVTKGKLAKCKIIGHPIQLQHWLRALGGLDYRHHYHLYLDGGLAKYQGGLILDDLLFNFDLATANPATEADYKAFCELLGIQ